MISTLITTLVSIYAFYGLYLIYCTIRASKRNGKFALAPWYVRGIAYSYLVLGVSIDFAFNITIGALFFWESPWGHGRLFTARCASHRKDGGWRQVRADWVCEGWLNPYEDHC